MLCLLEESAFRQGPEHLCSSVHAWGCSVWAGLLEHSKRIPTVISSESECVSKSRADFSVLTWARLPPLSKVLSLKPRAHSAFLKSFTPAENVLTTQLWLHQTVPLSFTCWISCLFLRTFFLIAREYTPWHPYFHSQLCADKVVTLSFHLLTCHSLFNTLQPACAPAGHWNFSHRLPSLLQSFLLSLLDCLAWYEADLTFE